MDKKRGTFQLHLSTIIALSMATGVLMWANLAPYSNGRFGFPHRHFSQTKLYGALHNEPPYYEHENRARYQQYGWPVGAYSKFSGVISWKLIVTDALCALSLLFNVAVFLEYRQTARPRLKSWLTKCGLWFLCLQFWFAIDWQWAGHSYVSILAMPFIAVAIMAWLVTPQRMKAALANLSLSHETRTNIKVAIFWIALLNIWPWYLPRFDLSGYPYFSDDYYFGWPCVMVTGMGRELPYWTVQWLGKPASAWHPYGIAANTILILAVIVFVAWLSERNGRIKTADRLQ